MKNKKTNVGSFASAKLQAKMRSISAIIAVVAVIGFTMIACNKSGGGGEKSINSAEELKEHLDKQPVNGPDKPIKVSMNINDPILKNVVDVINTAEKYVSLNLSDSALTYIPKEAFRECETLVNIIIPDSVTSIGKESFVGCTSLAGITIPNSVTSIGNDAFSGCTSLTSITIPDSVTSIENGTFTQCTSLASITIPNSVTSIGNDAFSGCTSLTSITIPDSVTGIENGTFSGCTSLTSVTIGKGVESIGDRAFYNSGLLTINVDNGNLNYSSDHGVLYNKNKTSLIAYPPQKPDSSFIIPNSVTSIEKNAFSLCASLVNITIPDNVTSIGRETFSGCTSLASITVNSGNTAYASEDGIVYNKAKTEFVIVPQRLTGNVTIPNGVTGIEDGAFSGCTGLTSVTIPHSVTSIGWAAFQNCTSLASVTIPDSVTSIGRQVFEGCTSLASITIPNSVQEIWFGAFSGCTSLASVTIPNSVQEIWAEAFERCTSLTSVTFQGTIAANNLSSMRYIGIDYHIQPKTFYGDLQEKYLAGGIGTYTTTAPVNDDSKWTKQ